MEHGAARRSGGGHVPECKVLRAGTGVGAGRLQLERDAVSYMSPNYDPLLETGQMVLLNGNLELLPGISLKVFPGHTANMQAVMIESGNKKACYISDLLPTSPHLELTWVMAFDLFPLQTIARRRPSS